MKPKDPWISASKAAERLGLDVSVIYKLLNQKVLQRVWLKLPNPSKASSKGRFGVTMQSISQYEMSLQAVNEREGAGFRDARKG